MRARPAPASPLYPCKLRFAFTDHPITVWAGVILLRLYTRHRIQGIYTDEKGQIIFVDTPGVHKPGHLLNRRMMAAVHDALMSVDVVVLMRDASVSPGNGDKFVLDLVKNSGKKANSDPQQD